MIAARVLPLFAVTAGLLVPAPVSACSYVWTPFGGWMEQLGPGQIAVQARATITLEHQTDSSQRGTLRLRAIQCLASRQSPSACPSRLAIPFEHHWDGASCPGPFDNVRPEHAADMRYFILWRGEDGRWAVLHAAREMWRR